MKRHTHPQSSSIKLEDVASRNALPLLGGSWDIVTTYNWGSNPTDNWGRGVISRVISPVKSSY